MKITVIVKGIGLTYMKDGLWKVVYPVDSCHQLKFAYQKNAEKVVELGSLAAPGRVINIATTKATSQSGTAKDLEEFVDLTADYSHKEIVFKDDWRKVATEMILNNAVLSVGSLANSKFAVERDGEITHPPGIFGAVLKAEIEIGDGGKLDIVIDGNSFKSFDYEPEASYTLIFDNDCHRLENINLMSTEEYDFQMYYNIIQDAEDPKTEIALVSPPEEANSSEPDAGEDSEPSTDKPADEPPPEYPCWIAYSSKINSSFP